MNKNITLVDLKKVIEKLGPPQDRPSPIKGSTTTINQLLRLIDTKESISSNPSIFGTKVIKDDSIPVGIIEMNKKLFYVGKNFEFLEEMDLGKGFEQILSEPFLSLTVSNPLTNFNQLP